MIFQTINILYEKTIHPKKNIQIHKQHVNPHPTILVHTHTQHHDVDDSKWKMRCRTNLDDAHHNVYDADMADAVHKNPFAKGITPVNRRVMDTSITRHRNSERLVTPPWTPTHLGIAPMLHSPPPAVVASTKSCFHSRYLPTCMLIQATSITTCTSQWNSS